jgi:protein-disulfide isomerase
MENKNNMIVNFSVVLLALSFLLFVYIAFQIIYPTMRDINKTLARVEKSFSSGGPAGGGDLGAIMLTQQDMQKRLTAMETKVDTIFGGLANLGGNARAAQAEPPRPPSEDYNKVYDLDVESSPVRGNKDAKVTIVEFVDLQCPFCARFHPAIEEVLKVYPNDVRYVAKHFPLSFHQEAKPAAKAALAAGEQGKFYEMMDLILKNNANLNAQRYLDFAKELKLNLEKFEKDLREKDEQWEQKINTDMQLGANSDVRGTPTFYLNGKKTTARTFDQYKSEIDKIFSN